MLTIILGHTYFIFDKCELISFKKGSESSRSGNLVKIVFYTQTYTHAYEINLLLKKMFPVCAS